MSDTSKVGDKVGYVLLQNLDGGWVDVDDWRFSTIGQAVGMLEGYQEDWPTATYAVGRIELAMISRPSDARDLLDPRDLLGICPDFTGGLSVDEYMDEQRGRGGE